MGHETGCYGRPEEANLQGVRAGGNVLRSATVLEASRSTYAFAELLEKSGAF
jgi:hypothetical protein